jgi:O-glycosyl hydrolase
VAGDHRRRERPKPGEEFSLVYRQSSSAWAAASTAPISGSAIALDENHGPHLGGCGTCNGTFTVNSQTRAVTYNDQYRDIEHFSKFVPPGAGATVTFDWSGP